MESFEMKNTPGGSMEELVVPPQERAGTCTRVVVSLVLVSSVSALIVAACSIVFERPAASAVPIRIAAPSLRHSAIEAVGIEGETLENSGKEKPGVAKNPFARYVRFPGIGLASEKRGPQGIVPLEPRTYVKPKPKPRSPIAWPFYGPAPESGLDRLLWLDDYTPRSGGPAPGLMIDRQEAVLARELVSLEQQFWKALSLGDSVVSQKLRGSLEGFTADLLKQFQAEASQVEAHLFFGEPTAEPKLLDRLTALNFHFWELLNLMAASEPTGHFLRRFFPYNGGNPSEVSGPLVTVPSAEDPTALQAHEQDARAQLFAAHKAVVQLRAVQGVLTEAKMAVDQTFDAKRAELEKELVLDYAPEQSRKIGRTPGENFAKVESQSLVRKWELELAKNESAVEEAEIEVSVAVEDAVLQLARASVLIIGTNTLTWK